VSEENKNRNKDKGKQKNIANKYKTDPKHQVQMAKDPQFLNQNENVNQRKRNDNNQYR